MRGGAKVEWGLRCWVWWAFVGFWDFQGGFLMSREALWAMMICMGGQWGDELARGVTHQGLPLLSITPLLSLHRGCSAVVFMVFMILQPAVFEVLRQSM